MEEVNKWKGNRREIGEDFFETPVHAINPILKYIPNGVKTIWEPTYGKGAIGNVLEDQGYNVIKTDKFPKTDDTSKFDFLTDMMEDDYDMLIFNPPFSLKTQFLQKVVALNKPFMFICPTSIMETATRSALINKHQISIINLSNRINYVGKKGNKVFFPSVWVLGDNKGKLYYAEVNAPRIKKS